MGVMDFLFGAGALKKAAGTKDDSKDTSTSQSAGLDMGRLAQESADRQKSQSASSKPAKTASPLSTTMTPMTTPKKAKQ